MRRTPSLLLTFLLSACACSAQQRDDLSGLAERAGIIFRGVVLSVASEQPNAPDEVACSRIVFRVEDGIRGTRSGETLTIRQWNAMPDEYRVGEMLVLFLYSPSKELGLTSPVGGKDGHRRPAEVSSAALDLLRRPSLVTEDDVEVIPVRRPRKLLRNPKEREVPQ